MAILVVDRLEVDELLILLRRRDITAGAATRGGGHVKAARGVDVDVADPAFAQRGQVLGGLDDREGHDSHRTGQGLAAVRTASNSAWRPGGAAGSSGWEGVRRGFQGRSVGVWASTDGSCTFSCVMTDKPTVFISYSRADKAWKDRLVRHLHVLSAYGLVDTWEDSRITTGSKWRREIEQAMGQASVAILLVSADFLSSKFVLNTEIPRLLERRKDDGLRIIPILVAPCDWEAIEWLATIQFHADARPMLGCSEHETEEIFAAIAKEIRRLSADGLLAKANRPVLQLHSEHPNRGKGGQDSAGAPEKKSKFTAQTVAAAVMRLAIVPLTGCVVASFFPFMGLANSSYNGAFPLVRDMFVPVGIITAVEPCFLILSIVTVLMEFRLNASGLSAKATKIIFAISTIAGFHLASIMICLVFLENIEKHHSDLQLAWNVLVVLIAIAMLGRRFAKSRPIDEWELVLHMLASYGITATIIPAGIIRLIYMGDFYLGRRWDEPRVALYVYSICIVAIFLLSVWAIRKSQILMKDEKSDSKALV